MGILAGGAGRSSFRVMVSGSRLRPLIGGGPVGFGAGVLV